MRSMFTTILVITHLGEMSVGNNPVTHGISFLNPSASSGELFIFYTLCDSSRITLSIVMKMDALNDVTAYKRLI